MWDHYKNFDLVAYLNVYYIAQVSNEDIGKDIDEFLSYAPLKKIYIENHRAGIDIPVERLREVKKIFEDRGIKTSGGIFPNGAVDGKKKPSMLDSFCYSDEAHKAYMMGRIEDLASVFD